MILDQRVVVGELSPGDKQIYELPVALLPNRTMNEQFTVARSESSGLVTRFIDVIQKEDGNMVRVEIGAAADCPGRAHGDVPSGVLNRWPRPRNPRLWCGSAGQITVIQA